MSDFRRRSISRGGKTVRLGTRKFLILTALLAARGPLTLTELTDHVYGDREDGGPDDAKVGVSRAIAKMRNGMHCGRHHDFWYPSVLVTLGLKISYSGHGYKLTVVIGEDNVVYST